MGPIGSSSGAAEWLTSNIQNMKANIRDICKGNVMEEDSIATIFSEAKSLLERGTRIANLSDFKESLNTIRLNAVHVLRSGTGGQTKERRICQALSNGAEECLKALEKLKGGEQKRGVETAYSSPEILLETKEKDKPPFTAQTALKEVKETGIFHQDILNECEKELKKIKIDPRSLPKAISQFTYDYCDKQFDKQLVDNAYLIRKSSSKPDEADKVYYVITRRRKSGEGFETTHRYFWQNLSTGKWETTNVATKYNSVKELLDARYSDSLPIKPSEKAENLVNAYLKNRYATE